MTVDERATVTALDTARAVFRKQIESNQGRVIDMAGDSVLAVFDTAAGAASAAIAIQSELHALTRDLPEERRLLFRVGVHLGDVIEKSDGTIYGDGVNIAARLQTKAPPGEICMSQTVYDTVRGKIPMAATFLGPEPLKNISHPVPIWHVAPVNGRTAQVSGTRSEQQWKTADGERAVDSKSIAVLPFANMSDDRDTGYFADGVHEDLLTQLALVGELKVVSRTSVMEYRETRKNIRQIASELQVGSLVEGTVRRAGSQVRVTAQLIDAGSDKHMWAKSYDRELKDIFAIQSELSTEIAKALKVTLSPNAVTQLATRSTGNLQAYDFFLRARELYNQSEVTLRLFSSIEDRIALLSKAVEADPEFALAWARLGAEHARAHFYDVDPTDACLARARQAIDRAITLAADDVAVKHEVGNFYLYGLRDYPRAARYLEDLLQVAPNNVDIIEQLSVVKRRLGRWPEAIALLERALAIDPRKAASLRLLRENLTIFRHWEEAVAVQRRAVAIAPDDLGELARLHGLQSKESGSFAAYDSWRNALPVDAAQRWPFIWFVDLDRAAAHGDLDAALHLLEALPPVSGWEPIVLQKEVRALALLAKGERLRAQELARSSLQEAAAELKKRPQSGWVLTRCFINQAILGERDAAFATYWRWHGIMTSPPDALNVMFAATYKVHLHAALGEHDRALEVLSQLMKRHEWITALSIPLRYEPRYRALAKDPANTVPLPIVNWDVEKMLAES